VKASDTDNSQSSFKFFLHHLAIEKVQSLLHGFLIFSLLKVPIPDQQVGAIGVNIYLTNMFLQNMTWDATNEHVIFNSPNEITLSISGVSGVATMDWRYTDGPLIDWKGTAQDYISDSSFSITLVLASVGNGHATLGVSAMDVNLNNLDIHLQGDGGSFFQFIAKMISPVLRKVVNDKLSSTLQDTLNNVLGKAINNIPVQTVVGNKTDLYFGLIQSNAVHGLIGSSYSDNHFSGGQSSYALLESLNGRTSIGAYDSFDVNGYVTVPVDGSYSFQITHTQRGQLDIAGQSVGKLETWNIGMCWIQTNTETTSPISMKAGQFYPIRLRYQSGCGGGWIELNQCDTTGCHAIGNNYISSQATLDTPIAVYPDYIAVSSVGEFKSLVNTSAIDNLPHHTLPNTLPALGTVTPSMLSVALDEHFINSLMVVMVANDKFRGTFTDAMIPADSPIRLNVTNFAYAMPDLYALYPNMGIQLEFDVYDGIAPLVTFSKDNGISLSGGFSAQLSVIDDKHNNQLIPFFDIGINVTASAKISIDNEIITGVISALDIEIYTISATVKETNITTDLDPFLKNIISYTLLPYINQLLAKGYPIPNISLIKFVNTAISYDDHILNVGTDFDFHF